MRTIVVILGPGAAGKSTLTRNVCGGSPTEYIEELVSTDKAGVEVKEKAKYTLYPNGFAIAGNVKNGSDSISRMENLNTIIDICLNKAEVVIVDGVRSSQKFIDWVQEHPQKPAALFIYFNLSLEENLRRLKNRREANGKSLDLPEKTYNNVLEFRNRAERVWQYMKSSYKRLPFGTIEIFDDTDPNEVVKIVQQHINSLRGFTV